MVDIRRPTGGHNTSEKYRGRSSGTTNKGGGGGVNKLSTCFRCFLICVIIGQSIHLLIKFMNNSSQSNSTNAKNDSSTIKQQYLKSTANSNNNNNNNQPSKTTTVMDEMQKTTLTQHGSRNQRHHVSLEDEVTEDILPDRLHLVEKTDEDHQHNNNNEEVDYHEQHLLDNEEVDTENEQEDSNNERDGTNRHPENDNDADKDQHEMKHSQPSNSNNNQKVPVGVVSNPSDNANMAVLKDPDTQETVNQHGTGPSKLGYVVDLVQERMHESFRSGTIPDQKYYDTVQLKVEQIVAEEQYSSNTGDHPSHSMISSCESIQSNGGRMLVQRVECWKDENKDEDDVTSAKYKYYAYNPAPFPRTLPCGSGDSPITIPPGGVVVLDRDTIHHVEKCLHQPASLFPQNRKNKQQHHNPDNDADNDGDDDDEGYVIVTNKPVKNIEELQHDASYELRTLSTCDVPCKHSKSIIIDDDDNDDPSSSGAKKIEAVAKQPQELYVAGTGWKIIRTMQDPYNYVNAKVERTAFREDVYYSTSSFQSSVPLSFYNFDQYNLNDTKAIPWTSTPNKATYLLDSDCSAFRRNKWYAAALAVMPIEAYGSCHHNTNLGSDETINTPSGRIQLLQKNRIALIFDAGGEKDYITPQIWESLLSGAIPAIHGASNAVKHLPKASNSNNPTAIYTSDFNNWDKFAEFVKLVANNQTLWDTYHAWRTDRAALERFATKYNFTKTSPDCRLCRWAYAKKYGYGWDHQQQIITETYIPHQICMNKDDNKLVSHPFREVWIGGSIIPVADDNVPSPPTIHDKNNEHCHASMTDSKSETISATNYDDPKPIRKASISRRVFYHDGVTDIYIDKIDKAADNDGLVTLRLQLNVRNTEGAYFRNTHTLVSTIRGPLMSSISVQDEHVKITVLTNFETTMQSPMAGFIDITISKENEKEDDNVSDQQHYVKTTKRIRIITEDTNRLHDKMTEFYPSHFGKIMMMDFIDPLEFFYTEVQHEQDEEVAQER